MNTPLRTSNAAFVAALFRHALETPYEKSPPLTHGLITTANASLFDQTHFSEPLHTYALGWSDRANYREVSDFIAPQVLTSGDKYEHTEYPNAEAFIAEVSGDDDLRAINAEFKTVEYTEGKATRSIPNRGLRMVIDKDRIKNKPGWETYFTNRLLQRLERNAAIRKVALALAAGVAVSKTWSSGTPDMDYDVAAQAQLGGDIVGFNPNRALIGQGANLIRFQAAGLVTNQQIGVAARTLMLDQVMQKFGLQTLVDNSRYQSGVSKVALLGNKILLFTAMEQSGEDPSNFKSARGTTEQGGFWGIYLRQIGVKFWELTVECYEMEWVASTLGVRTITVS